MMAMLFLRKLALAWLFLSGHFIPGLQGLATHDLYIQRGDVYLAGLHVIRDYNSRNFCSQTIKRLEGFQLFLGAVRAIELANDNSSSGIKLGMIHMDTCHRDVTATMETLQILFPAWQRHSSRWTDADEVAIRKGMIGLVGPIHSGEAKIVSNILQLFNTSLVSPTASGDDLNDRVKYPNFFRTTSPSSYQAKVMGMILEFFQWTYISIVYSEGPYGFSGLKGVRSAVYNFGGCVANSHPVGDNFISRDYEDIITKLRVDYRARTVVVIMDSQKMNLLLQAAQKMGTQGEFLYLLSKNGSPQTFQGVEDVVEDSLLLSPYTFQDPSLSEFIHNISPSVDGIPWLPMIWQQHLGCSVENTTCARKKLGDIDGFKMYHNAVLSSYAVKAFAAAINDLIEAECPGINRNDSMLHDCVNSGSVSRYLKNATIRRADSIQARFNSEGFHEEKAFILQLQMNSKGSVDLTPVAIVNAQKKDISLTGEFKWMHEKFRLDLTRYDYKTHDGGSALAPISFQKPESICAKPCRQEEIYLKGTSSCCWDCIECRDNEIVSNNATRCSQCKLLTWPNMDKSDCLPIAPSFLTWTSWYSIGLLALSGLGLFLSLYIFYIVARYRHRKVIKGGNWKMLMLIVSGLTTAYVSVFLFIARPTNLICLLSRIGFGISCTLIFAPVLVKTSSVYQVFEAASKLSRSVKFAAPKLQMLLFFIIMVIQVALVSVSQIKWLVSAQKSMPVPTIAYVELACEQDLQGLLIPLGFNMLLLLICSILGFLTRQLPDNFNESWYIFICVSGTLFVWIAFLPTYFSAFYAYHKAALLALALILNGYVTTLCFFAPKIYALKYVGEKNVQISLMDFSSAASSTGNNTMRSELSVSTNKTATKQNNNQSV